MVVAVELEADRSGSQTVRAQLAIRDLVLKGTLTPGERISELSMVARIGVSRTPVRAALLRLAEEGLLEPLRFLPKGKTVVLGLVTSKTGSLEKKEFVKRRIDEAAKFAPLEQLCLSPQCGFASTEEGNTLAEDEQWRKLEMIVEVAREVWG